MCSAKGETPMNAPATEFVLNITGTTCDCCVRSVTKALQAMPGVERVSVTLNAAIHDNERAPLAIDQGGPRRWRACVQRYKRQLAERESAEALPPALAAHPSVTLKGISVKQHMAYPLASGLHFTWGDCDETASIAPFEWTSDRETQPARLFSYHI
jgi:copper chaperone CopZ